MKVAIGSDHRGFGLKKKLVDYLQKKGHQVFDFGTFSRESCDYPLYCARVAESVAAREAGRGIFICKTGIGSCIALNKVKGIRAALVHNIKGARFSRLHNDANVLVLGSDFVTSSYAEKIAKVFLDTEFEAGRHRKRITQIKKMEQGHGL